LDLSKKKEGSLSQCIVLSSIHNINNWLGCGEDEGIPQSAKLLIR